MSDYVFVVDDDVEDDAAVKASIAVAGIVGTE